MIKKEHLNIKKFPRANKTIICFHGILNDGYSNSPVEEIAQELNYNYISYTFPMHGNNHEKNVSVINLIEIAKEVIKLSPTKKIILFGHSAGANWVNQCLKFYGDSYFQKIILIDPINSSLKFINMNKLKTFEKIAFKEKAGMDALWNDFKNVNILFENYTYLEAHLYIHLVVKLCNKKFLLSTNEVYEKTKVPILIIAGENDMVIDTERSKELFSTLNPNIKFVVMPNCGHSPHFDNKPVFKKLVKKFLA